MGCCCSRVWVGKREERGRREGETERREGALKKSLTECICYQPLWMMLSVWLAWKRSSALHIFTSNPRICKGRTMPSVNKCALKMQKVPSQSQPKGATKALVRLPVERREKKRRNKRRKAAEMHLVCWVAFGAEHAAILPLHPTYVTAKHSDAENVFYEEQTNVQW